MAPTYKLTYFNIKGRAELARLLFAAAGVEYEDHRIQLADWAALKPTLPFKQIPVLEIDGKVYAQSRAITNYLANEYGFYGESVRDRLEIDQVLEVVKEFIFFVDRIFVEKDKSVQAEMMKEVLAVHSVKYLTYLEIMITASNTGFFVGDKLSYADLAAFDITDWMHDRSAFPSADFPGLTAFREKISSIDVIKHYLATRNNKYQ